MKRPKNVVWQSSDGRVTSDHCRVTVQRLFSKLFFIAWNVQKTLFDSRSTVAWPQPLSRDRSATFFKNFANCLKRPKNVVWQSADGRVSSSIVAWPFSDFFQNFPKSLETSRKRCLTVGRRSRDLRPLSRDRSATFFINFANCLKRPKNVVWQSADGRVTSDHCRVTVQRLFSLILLIAWNVQKTLFDSRPTVAWPQPLSRDRSATFFNFFSNCLKRPKNVVWQSADGRVTSDHCRVTVQRLFSNFFLIAWNVQKTLFDSQPTVAWPPTTVAWPFSDFFQKTILIAWNVQKTLFDSRPTVAWPQPLSRDRSATFFKIFPNRLKRPKTLFDSRPTVAWPPTTVAWPFSDFFQFFSKCLKRTKNVVWQSADGRVTSTTVAWPFSDFLLNFPKSLETSKKRCLTVRRRSRDLRPLSRDRSATFSRNF